MKIIRFQELPAELQTYAQVVMAYKRCETEKDQQKDPALKSLQAALGDEKCILAISHNNFVQFDINPQAHVEFNPAMCPDIVAAQEEVKKASARLAVVVAAATEAGRARKNRTDSIRVEVLSEAKLVPLKAKYAQQIRATRKKKGAVLCAA